MTKTLYYGGAVHTMRAEKEVFHALGTEGDRIIFIGDIGPVGPNRHGKMRVNGELYDTCVDLQGKHIYPALTDAHLHLLYTMVLSASSFHLCRAGAGGVWPSDLKGVEKRIRSYCQKHPKQKIIAANQYILSGIREKRLPNRRELDEWTNGRQMIIYNIDGHSSALSTALMKRLSLPIQGHDGRFSGEEHEFMQGRVMNIIASAVTPSVLAKGIANFSNLCAHYGISRVCAMDGNEDVKKDPLTKFLAILASRMEIDVRLFPQYMDFNRTRPLQKYQRNKRAGGCGSWELDGSVGSHSAAFYLPFKDTGERGHCYYKDAWIERKVRQAIKEGIQLSCHAIGEAAIDQIVRIYDKVLTEKERKQRQHSPMPRIDHFEFPSREAVDKIKRLPVALTIQPGFSWLDKRYIKSYRQFLPEEKEKQQIPLKELYNAGVCLCGSSDSPVQSIHPYEQMLGMAEFYNPEQSLTPYQAMRTYTMNPAVMLGEERETGTLEPGKKADFFVAEEDFFQMKPERMGEFHADFLIKDGKRYRKKKGTAFELFLMLLHKKKKL